ncbi:hypothetical protein NE237_009462 [Protea cynaroides]|uniref:Uncharacterized protein n=1 Tax=Protea cynaroides TaxID=273540 RepID=A0A9Q0KXI5_9MAGN|nr:hypothetical protein NE237_009462 [Protea cynaroides]
MVPVAHNPHWVRPVYLAVGTGRTIPPEVPVAHISPKVRSSLLRWRFLSVSLSFYSPSGASKSVSTSTKSINSSLSYNMSKRRGAGKRSYMPGMNPPHPPPVPYDARFFRSEATASRLAWFRAKRIEVGRFVNLEHLHRFNIEAAFGAMGWLPIIQYRETTRPSLVKLFFANLEVEGDPNDWDNARDLRITSYVKGMMISFNTAELAALLEIPDDGDLIYCPPRAKGYLTEDMRAAISE